MGETEIPGNRCWLKIATTMICNVVATEIRHKNKTLKVSGDVEQINQDSIPIRDGNRVERPAGVFEPRI
jgi:hypothetical protein